MWSSGAGSSSWIVGTAAALWECSVCTSCEGEGEGGGGEGGRGGREEERERGQGQARGEMEGRERRGLGRRERGMRSGREDRGGDEGALVYLGECILRHLNALHQGRVHLSTNPQLHGSVCMHDLFPVSLMGSFESLFA